MALSRIWSAFIIIAIVVAGFKCFVTDNNKTIFSTMIIGKSGDTIKIGTSDTLQHKRKYYGPSIPVSFTLPKITGSLKQGMAAFLLSVYKMLMELLKLAKLP